MGTIEKTSLNLNIKVSRVRHSGEKITFDPEGLRQKNNQQRVMTIQTFHNILMVCFISHTF